MFTDNPTIPAQLEVLLDVIHAMHQRKADVDALRQLIQPKGLPDVTPNSAQLDQHLSAARELGLVRTDDNNNVRLNYSVRAAHDARAAIVTAFERIALADARAEKWAGRFYGYLIAQPEDDVLRSRAEIESLAHQFMSHLSSEIEKSNPMNADKHRALLRWYPYVGLGWMDPAGSFTPDPTARLARALPAIWREDRKLDAQEFMERVAQACPELDGGALFNEATHGLYFVGDRRCTQALASALRRLHDDGQLRLRCPPDSRGWSLEKAGSGPVSQETSNRFDTVEWSSRSTH